VCLVIIKEAIVIGRGHRDQGLGSKKKWGLMIGLGGGEGRGTGIT